MVNKDSQGNKLQIRSAGYNDSGSYVCTTTNVLGEAKKVVTLFVEGKMLRRKKKNNNNDNNNKKTQAYLKRQL